MAEGERYCCQRWMASRVEADTHPVEHMCELPKGHRAFLHHCSCGAESADG